MENKKQYQEPQMKAIVVQDDIVRTSDFEVDVDQWDTDDVTEPEA